MECCLSFIDHLRRSDRDTNMQRRREFSRSPNKPSKMSLTSSQQELDSWLAGAGSSGVIYFSLGSIARGETMPPEYRQSFLEAFRRLPQRILWKYEGDLEGASDNVRVSSWLPQQDVLGKKVTLLQLEVHCYLITHVIYCQGGLLIHLLCRSSRQRESLHFPRWPPQPSGIHISCHVTPRPPYFW